jgi:TonB family protein
MPNSPPASPAPAAHDPVAQTLALLQPWIEYVPQQQRRLGLFIFLALMVHLATFFFIRIDTTRAELQHATRIHVSVEYPQAIAVNGQPGDQFWDRLTDPRAYLLPLNPQADAASIEPPLDLNSNLAAQDLPAAAPPTDYHAAPPVVTSLEQQVEEAMIPPRQPFAYDETPPAIANKTSWELDAALAARQPAGVPDLPSPISDTDLSPTVLSVAVAPSGTVEHVMVEQSCGGDLGADIAKDLDQQAVQAARKIRFQPTDQPGLQWGRITVFWRYSAKPQEEVVPTPPSTGP